MADKLTGDQGSFTFSGNSPSFTMTNLTTLEIDMWELTELGRKVNSTVPFGYLGERHSVSTTLRGYGKYRFQAITGTTPPIPVITTTMGTLRLTLASGRYYEGTAVISALGGMNANSTEASDIDGMYAFRFGAQATATAPVTAT